MWIKTFITILFLMVSSPCFATTYYVRNGGSESNTGLSGAQAWAYIPGTSGSTHSPSPGDTVYCDRDSTWTFTTNTSVPSTTWAPLPGVIYNGSDWEYDGGATGTRAKIEYTGPNSGAFSSCITFWADNASYATAIDGFDIDGNGIQIDGILFVAVTNTAGQLSIDKGVKRLKNCLVHNFHSVSAAEGYNYMLRIYPAYNLYGGGDTNLRHVRYVELLDNTFYTASRAAIGIYPIDSHVYARDVIVRGNNIYDVGHQVGYEFCGYYFGHAFFVKGNAIDVTFENNYIHDLSNGADHILLSTSDGFASYENNIIIRNNIFKFGRSTGYVGRGVINRDYSDGATARSVSIYGNIFIDGGPIISCSGGNSGIAGIDLDFVAGTGDFRVYNNTLYLSPISVSSGAFSLLHVQNNISYGTGSGITVSETGAHVTVSNNLTTSPGFKNTSNLPTGFTGTYPTWVPNNDGLSITAGGAAIDAGINLGTSYNTSINGITRLGSWDIGAYEYGSGIPTWGYPSPPSGLGISWLDWEISQGVKGTIIGDPDWGALQIDSGTTYKSSVRDTGTADRKTFFIQKDLYDTGSGTVNIYIRGDITPFNQHDVSPSWNLYTVPTTQNWRYVQIKIELVP